MTKRDCEQWFALIADVLDPSNGYGSPATHARLIAGCARDLLAEERQRNAPKLHVEFDPDWPNKVTPSEV